MMTLNLMILGRNAGLPQNSPEDDSKKWDSRRKNICKSKKCNMEIMDLQMF